MLWNHTADALKRSPMMVVMVAVPLTLSARKGVETGGGGKGRSVSLQAVVLGAVAHGSSCGGAATSQPTLALSVNMLHCLRYEVRIAFF